MKTPAIKMVRFRTTREEVQGIYNEVYQQKRLPGPLPYRPEWMEALDWEICTSFEEQMWQRQGTAGPEEDWEYFAAQPPDQIPSLDLGKE